MRWLRAPTAALDDDFAVAGDLGEAVGHVVLRDQLSADLGDLVLVGLAHVEEEDVFAGIDAALSSFTVSLGNAVLHVFLLWGFGHDAAEMLVVDELR